MSDYIPACTKEEIPEGKAKLLQFESRFISIFNVGGTYYAIDDQCTHRGAPLSEGRVEGTVVTCPWHGAKFDLTDGTPKGGPVSLKLKTYPVRLNGNTIEIKIN